MRQMPNAQGQVGGVSVEGKLNEQQQSRLLLVPVL